MPLERRNIDFARRYDTPEYGGGCRYWAAAAFAVRRKRTSAEQPHFYLRNATAQNLSCPQVREGSTHESRKAHSKRMNPAYIVRDTIDLTLAGAQAIVAAAIAKANEIGVDECIAVVDRGGALLAYARMDGGRIASTAIAVTKAVSAATRRRPTSEEMAGDVAMGIRLALASDNAVTNIGGGFPIIVAGQTIGAIGVSSGTVDEDTIVAKAGLHALE